METPLTPVEVFYSCAEADARWLDQLASHLAALRNQGEIITWHRRQAEPGSDWRPDTAERLRSASLLLLLVSPAFLASEYLYRVELPQIMQRQHANGVHVLPLLVRPCDWSGTPFAHMQMLPRTHLPLSQWPDPDAGFAEIAQEIRAILRTLRQSPADLSSLAGTPSPAQPAIWHLPFARNPFFTGREDLLEQLHTQLQLRQPTAIAQPQAISGLGGIGKSQLAIEYAYRYRQEYRAILWVRAETSEALTASYSELARLLHLPQQEAQDQQIVVHAVKTWLSSRNDWLLILDNADDLKLAWSFLPGECPGHLVLTTRAQVMGKLARRLEVETLDQETGALLLLRRSGLVETGAPVDAASPEDQSLARALTAALDGLPLALDQAGAYIEETACGLSGYLQEYEERRAHLLAHRGMLPDDHPEPVATTWSLSFEKVESANPTAAYLLRTCAFLAPDDIPEALLARALQMAPPPAGDAEKQQPPLPAGEVEGQEQPLAPVPKGESLNQAVAILRTYSLVRRNPAQQTLAVHRLVQAVLRESLSEAEQQAWVRHITLLLNEALPSIEFAHWQLCEQYVPHAQECARLASGRIGAAEARLCYWVGGYLLQRQRTREAEPYVRQALLLRERHLGKEHPQTAASLDSMARWWELQGKYAQAEPLYVRALGIRERELGASHPDTATSLNNLAGLYYSQGKYAQAEPLYVRALGIYERELGASHPDTASSLNNLAGLYESQGRYEEAEPLLQRALTIREKALGSEHPDTALSLWWLAVLAEQQRHNQEAKSLYERALAIYERTLGIEHADTQRVQDRYTALLREMKRNKGASS